MYAWESGPALVQTVDFFTPIVDDPYLYGQIAAANSLSDVYAMGGRPLTALAIAAFPKTALHTDDIAQIFRGGFDKLREAGVALLGGHTVQDREIKFGYAVTGAIDPKRILTNAGAKPGDRLILTKPLGTGIVGTAIKFGRASQDGDRSCGGANAHVEQGCGGSDRDVDGVHACTDITGFGLAGHASEMAAASQRHHQHRHRRVADHSWRARNRVGEQVGRACRPIKNTSCRESNSVGRSLTDAGS